MTTTLTRQNCLALPFFASTRRKAEMLAAGIETVFFDPIKTEVFQDGGKWCVAVVEGMEHIGDPDENESVINVFSLLLQFDFTDSTGEIGTPDGTIAEFAAAHDALTKRARRVFRIEDKLDAILTALVDAKGATALEQSGQRLTQEGEQ